MMIFILLFLFFLFSPSDSGRDLYSQLTAAPVSCSLLTCVLFTLLKQQRRQLLKKWSKKKLIVTVLFLFRCHSVFYIARHCLCFCFSCSLSVCTLLHAKQAHTHTPLMPLSRAANFAVLIAINTAAAAALALPARWWCCQKCALLRLLLLLMLLNGRSKCAMICCWRWA